MILAVKQDNLEIAALLLKQGGRSEFWKLKVKSARTALMWAVQGGNMKMISFLLKQGANPNTKGQVGMTSLIYVDHEDPFMKL